MKANHLNFKGNKNSGRKPLSIEMKFFDKLDKSLPEVVDYCIDTIQECQLRLLKKDLKLSDVKLLNDIALKASSILMSKAPQRISMPEGSLVGLFDKKQAEKLLDNI